MGIFLQIKEDFLLSGRGKKYVMTASLSEIFPIYQNLAMVYNIITINRESCWDWKTKKRTLRKYLYIILF
jgi:hypothetical protein